MKFSIRDLLLVTVIVALVLGWAIDHWRDNQRERQLQQERAELKWRVDALTQVLDVEKYRARFTDYGLELDKKDFHPAKWGSTGIPRPNRTQVQVIPRQGLPPGEY